MGSTGQPPAGFGESAGPLPDGLPSPNATDPSSAADGAACANLTRITWFEIPVHDLVRAVAFYTEVFGIELEITQNGDHAMAFFPASDGGLGGALVAGPGCIPSDKGTLVYLNVATGLHEALAQVESAGGRVVLGKTALGEAGYFALFIDTEGNKLALHAAE